MTVVIGVDPGGRSTGLVLVDTATAPGDDSLLGCTTVDRAQDGRPLTDVPADYLTRVMAVVLTWSRFAGTELLAIEGLNRPSGHVRILDPSGLIATAHVIGAIRGRAWSTPTVLVAPGRNGTSLPWTAYPTPIRGKSPAGQDARRHMRSAYDVALAGPAALRLERTRTR